MYTYDIDTAAMFEDRTDQFAKFGIPRDDIERVRSAVDDMWSDAPGGWVYEWSSLASEYAERGEHRMASLVYGCAKFSLPHRPGSGQGDAAPTRAISIGGQ